MKRKVILYIADRRADLDDDALILLNYTMEDLSNPAIVTNSYSKQITLQGTENNNKIFGDFWRNDRVTISDADSLTGISFDPVRKTPFTIYSGTGEILESGYAKLDSVERSGASVSYKVTLYGGLGSFLYSLSYNEDGSTKSLADIAYLFPDAPETELDFHINKTAVNEAWLTLDEEYPGNPGAWGVINFAPCYNGIPDNFAADTGIFVPSSVGAQDSVTEGGTTYGLKSGVSLVKLPEAVDEWAAKDMRSYLQRPVFSIKALWDALRNPDNCGGWELDIDDIEDGYIYSDLWMTLPLLPSLGTYKKAHGEVTASSDGSWSSTTEVARFNLSGTGDLPAGTRMDTDMALSLWQENPGTENTLHLQQHYAFTTALTYYYRSCAFLQAVAYDSLGEVVGGSRVVCIGYPGKDASTAKSAAEKFGYTPVWNDLEGNAWGEGIVTGDFARQNGDMFVFSRVLAFSIADTANISYIKVFMSGYHYTATLRRNSDGRNTWTEDTATADGSLLTLAGQESVSSAPPVGCTASTRARVTGGNGAGSVIITYDSTDNLRSDALITKRMLLSATDTPAAYILSLCKMFGLYFLTDPTERRVRIVTRNSLYYDDLIDLSDRVDLSYPVTSVPFSFDAKWYDWMLESVGGEFHDEYKSIQGREYGSLRINTGYEFNSEIRNVLEGNSFRSAVPVVGWSRYFNTITKGSRFYPSPFLDPGAKYTLWSSGNDTIERDVPTIPGDAYIRWESPTTHGYDNEATPMLQMHDASGKTLEGAGVLVLKAGWKYVYAKLTDDSSVMDTYNGGVPCWDLSDPEQNKRVPLFSTYQLDADLQTLFTLDFGVPKEVCIPGLTWYSQNDTFFWTAWHWYLEDRWHRDSRVMSCRVRLDGLPIGQSLLRHFWWYDGSLWVLNKVTNLSLTTDDPAECEFVRVQDKDRYTRGQ